MKDYLYKYAVTMLTYKKKSSITADDEKKLWAWGDTIEQAHQNILDEIDKNAYEVLIKINGDEDDMHADMTVVIYHGEHDEYEIHRKRMKGNRW